MISAKHTIVINGKVYDAVTGLPVAKPAPVTVHRPAAGANMDVIRPSATRSTPHNSKSVHHVTAHSTTLRREYLSAPESKVPVSAPKHHVAGHTGRSPLIAHFAAHPQPLPTSQHEIIAPVLEHTAIERHHAKLTPERLSSKEVKEKLITHASHNVQAVHHAAEQTKAKRKLRKPLRRAHIVTAAIAVALLGGYLTYVSMPGISVSVAGSQAGVAAKYPNYSPDGYSFEGPIEYQPGQVALNFKSNGGGKGYVIEQRASTWNSVALFDNFVESASKGNYERTLQNGVTIYTYGNNAAWTNGGVFYSINGEAPLDTDQLLQIAESM